MSSEIYYDRAFIKIGEEQFIPVANHGSSNTFDFDCGAERSRKSIGRY